MICDSLINTASDAAASKRMWLALMFSRDGSLLVVATQVRACWL
jgi:hypothetical protein